MNKQELLEKLGMKDPFEGFVPKENTKLWGWNGDSPIFGQLINEVKPKLILEIGSWMGQSAINMASNIKSQGLKDTTVLICIDTWLGSEEHWIDKKLIQDLELENGYPTFYKRFMSNVVNYGCQDVVYPLPMPSTIACNYLKNQSIRAELIYVDGSHETYDVLRDLRDYWELLEVGGAIYGDDLPWDSVKNAVMCFSAEIGKPFEAIGINWIFRK